MKTEWRVQRDASHVTSRRTAEAMVQNQRRNADLESDGERVKSFNAAGGRANLT